MKVIPPLKLDASQRYTVEEATRFLRQSRAQTYKQIRSGEISTISVGKRRYITGAEIARLSGAPLDGASEPSKFGMDDLMKQLATMVQTAHTQADLLGHRLHSIEATPTASGVDIKLHLTVKL